jgi:hypothetical protein
MTLRDQIFDSIEDIIESKVWRNLYIGDIVELDARYNVCDSIEDNVFNVEFNVSRLVRQKAAEL